jgi:hypothetical protein
MTARDIETCIDIGVIRILDWKLLARLRRRCEAKGLSLEEYCGEMLATALALDDELTKL